MRTAILRFTFTFTHVGPRISVLVGGRVSPEVPKSQEQDEWVVQMQGRRYTLRLEGATVSSLCDR